MTATGILLFIIGAVIGSVITNIVVTKIRNKRVRKTTLADFNSTSTPPENSRHVIMSDGETFEIGYFDRNDNQGRGDWHHQGGDYCIITPKYWIDIYKFRIT